MALAHSNLGRGVDLFYDSSYGFIARSNLKKFLDIKHAIFLKKSFIVGVM